jgi:hypothetical protein
MYWKQKRLILREFTLADANFIIELVKRPAGSGLSAIEISK